MTQRTDNTTHLADINEIMLGYYLNGKKWFDAEAKRKYQEKRDKVSTIEHDAQVGRAQAMDEEFRKWAKTHGYTQIKEVHWVARPGALQAAVGKDIDVDSRDNPTDILVEFSHGPANGFLGISAKTTPNRKDVNFKNPGIGPLDEELGIDMLSIVNKKIRKIVDMFGLSEIAAKRKYEIRSLKPKTREKVIAIGSEAESEVIDLLLAKYKKMKQEDLRNHFIKEWLNATKIYPPYVKVTGTGADAPYSAKVEDALKNERMAALNSGRISLVKVGNATIAVTAGGKHVMKIRAKFKDEKLASSFKFSADVWP